MAKIGCPHCGLALPASEWTDYALPGSEFLLPGVKCPECWAEMEEGELVEVVEPVEDDEGDQDRYPPSTYSGEFLP